MLRCCTELQSSFKATTLSSLFSCLACRFAARSHSSGKALKTPLCLPAQHQGSHAMQGRGEVWTRESWVFLRKDGEWFRRPDIGLEFVHLPVSMALRDLLAERTHISTYPARLDRTLTINTDCFFLIISQEKKQSNSDSVRSRDAI